MFHNAMYRFNVISALYQSGAAKPRKAEFRIIMEILDSRDSHGNGLSPITVVATAIKTQYPTPKRGCSVIAQKAFVKRSGSIRKAFG
jgi:hypothetical protein